MFSDLPNEMFPEIFNYLSQRELLNCFLLDKRFYLLIEDYIDINRFHFPYLIKSETSLYMAIKKDWMISITLSFMKGWYFHDYCFQ